MAMRSFEVDINEWEIFKRAVGDNNASQTLRNFIKTYSETTEVSERLIRKKFAIAEEEYIRAKSKYEKLKSRIESIDSQKKQNEIEQIKREEKERKKLEDVEYDTMKENLSRVV